MHPMTSSPNGIVKIGKGMHIKSCKNIQKFTKFLKYLKLLKVYSSLIYHNNWFTADWQSQKTLKIVRVSSKKYWDQKSCEKKLASKVFFGWYDRFFLFPEFNATKNNTVLKYYFYTLSLWIYLMTYSITC